MNTSYGGLSNLCTQRLDGSLSSFKQASVSKNWNSRSRYLRGQTLLQISKVGVTSVFFIYMMLWKFVQRQEKKSFLKVIGQCILIGAIALV